MPGEKTEKASLKRHEDERRKGHAFQSQDLTSSVSLLGIFAALKFFGPRTENTLLNGMQTFLTMSGETIKTPGDLMGFFRIAVGAMLGILVPIFAISVTAAIAVTLMQTRFLLTPVQLIPKFERISIMQGVKKLFSTRTAVEMLKSLLKMGAIFGIIWADVYPNLPHIMELFDTSLAGSVSYIAGLVIDVGFKASGVMLAFGVADCFYQWWDFEHSIRMTKQETKEEFKETEGNPQTKSRIRGIQRKLSRMRMMQEVPKADVVIRNPTHYAIALKYDEKSKLAPIVVAKGADAVALKIVEIAEKNKVYITENKPLAQALYKSVEIGFEIPAEFYKAVAEVLARLYSLRRAGRT